MGVMISCKEATLMIEKGQEHHIGLANKLKLAFHLAVCKVCAIYSKQSKLIDRALKQQSKRSMPAEELDSFKQQIKKNLESIK